jgi:hypothetical protein
MSGNFFLYVSKNFVWKNFLPLKSYTDRNFLATGGGGGGGEVAKRKFLATKFFQVKCEILIFSGRFNQTPPPPEVSSRDGTGCIRVP